MVNTWISNSGLGRGLIGFGWNVGKSVSCAYSSVHPYVLQQISSLHSSKYTTALPGTVPSDFLDYPSDPLTTSSTY